MTFVRPLCPRGQRPAIGRIALVGHDHKKQDLREWPDHNRELVAGHVLYATATTGRMLISELGLRVTRWLGRPRSPPARLVVARAGEPRSVRPIN